MFTDSQEIQEIRVTSVTALSYLVANESPPSLTPALVSLLDVARGPGAQEWSCSLAESWAGFMLGRSLQAFEDRVRGGGGLASLDARLT